MFMIPSTWLAPEYGLTIFYLGYTASLIKLSLPSYNQTNMSDQSKVLIEKPLLRI
jgi:hypothetical protein